MKDRDHDRTRSDSDRTNERSQFGTDYSAMDEQQLRTELEDRGISTTNMNRADMREALRRSDRERAQGTA
jgi:hypothetical protein